MPDDTKEKEVAPDHPLALAFMYVSIFVFGLSVGWLVLNAIYR